MIDANGKPMPNMGVVVGIPSSRLVMPEWAVALAVQAWPINTNVCYVPIHCGNKKTGWEGPPRDKARELIVESAQKMKAPYVWFIDDDVEVPFGACRQLMRTLTRAPKEVVAVAGIYPGKRFPIEPIVYRENGAGPCYDWEKGDIFPVKLAGTGCMIIKTSVFDQLEKPWFQDIDTDTLAMTDDAWFCAQLETKGFKVLADANVLCTHWDMDTMVPYRIEDSFFEEKKALAV